MKKVLIVFVLLLWTAVAFAGPKPLPPLPSVPGASLPAASDGYLKCDTGVYSWETPAGAGDVVGPASSTQYKIPLWGAADKTLIDGVAVGTAGMLLRSAGADANPAWSAYTLALPGLTGAVLYSDGTNWTRSATPSLTALTISGANSLGLGTQSANTGSINFKNSTNNNTLILQAGATGGNLTFTLPTAYPTIAGQLLSSGATGVLSWNGNPSIESMVLYGANSLALGSGSSSTAPGTGSILFRNETNDNTFTIASGASGASISWTLPTAAPGGANYLLNVSANGTMAYTDPASLGGGSVATDTIFDAKGDLAIGTGANTSAKFAIGANYSLMYPNSAAGGGTVGMAWLAPVNNSIVGYNSSGVLGAYTSIQVDDSAAQFYSATASKGQLKFDQTGISNTKTVTVKYTATDSYTWTPTILGNSSFGIGTTFTDGKWCTYATATGFTCAEAAPAGAGDVTGVGDCADGACYDGSSDGGTYIRLYDGTSAYESITGGVRLFTFASSTADAENLTLTLGNNDNTVSLTSSTGAANLIGLGSYSLGAAGVKLSGADGALTILGLGDGYDEDLTINLDTTENTATVSSSTGVTSVNFSALNLVTTGNISGAINIITDNDDHSVTGAEAYGGFGVATGTGTWTLPAAAAGMNFCVYSTTAAAVNVDVDGSDVITLNGTALSAGDKITSASGAGDFICLLAVSDSSWLTLGRSGVWTDGN